MLSCRGAMTPGRLVVILWGALTGLVAAVLLPAGGLEAVKQVAVIAAFPFPSGEPAPDDEVRPVEVMADSRPAG